MSNVEGPPREESMDVSEPVSLDPLYPLEETPRIRSALAYLLEENAPAVTQHVSFHPPVMPALDADLQGLKDDDMMFPFSPESGSPPLTKDDTVTLSPEHVEDQLGRAFLQDRFHMQDGGMGYPSYPLRGAHEMQTPPNEELDQITPSNAPLYPNPYNPTPANTPASAFALDSYVRKGLEGSPTSASGLVGFSAARFAASTTPVTTNSLFPTPANTPATGTGLEAYIEQRHRL